MLVVLLLFGSGGVQSIVRSARFRRANTTVSAAQTIEKSLHSDCLECSDKISLEEECEAQHNSSGGRHKKTFAPILKKPGIKLPKFPTQTPKTRPNIGDNAQHFCQYAI